MIPFFGSSLTTAECRMPWKDWYLLHTCWILMRWGPRKHRKENKWMPKILCPWKKNSPFNRDHYTIWHQPKQCTIKLNGKFMEIPPKLSYICWHSLIPPITCSHLMMPCLRQMSPGRRYQCTIKCWWWQGPSQHRILLNGEFVGSDRLENQKIPRTHRK